MTVVIRKSVMPIIPVCCQMKTYSESGGICITDDTLITMYDGTQKMVKDLVAQDKLLVFNHLTGQFECGIFLYDFHDDNHDSSLKEILKLSFSNGNELKIIEQQSKEDLQVNQLFDDIVGHTVKDTVYDNNNNDNDNDNI